MPEAYGIEEEDIRLGNETADHWAGEAAKKSELPWAYSSSIDATDATC